MSTVSRVRRGMPRKTLGDSLSPGHRPADRKTNFYRRQTHYNRSRNIAIIPSGGSNGNSTTVFVNPL